MTKGFVKWDDRDVLHVWLSANKQYGAFPDGEYGINTKIYYCCQNTPDKLSDPIELPVDRPFYLLPHSSSGSTMPRCQLVKGATSQLEYIEYDTAADIYAFGIKAHKSSDEGSGNRVFFKHLETTSRYMRVYYCYYKADCSKVTCAYGATCKVINDGAQLQCDCSTATCPYGATCKVIRGVAKCECDFTCDSKSLVCGSDLKTYDNECKMKEAACYTKKNVSVLVRDKCGDCSTITCAYGATCKVISGVAKCECDFTCSDSKSLVCGSDLKTYDNECKMKEAACKAKKDITVLVRDKCG